MYRMRSIYRYKLRRGALVMLLLLLASLPAAAQSPSAPSTAAEEAAARSWRWSVHTNTLLPLLNGGVAVHLGPRGRLSLGADWYWPWLRPFERDGSWCVEAQAAALELRWHLRDGRDARRRGTGLSVGLTALAGYYDLGMNRHGVQGEAAGATLDAMWTWPVNRGRWRLSLSAGGGLLMTQWRGYDVYDDGRAYRDGEWTQVMRYWGPMKAELRLSIPFWYKVREDGR